MKKLIIASILVMQLTTIYTFAENQDNEYVYRLNDTFGEMNLELEDKNKICLFKGINEGYIIPVNENNENLKEALRGLKETLEKEEIKNKKLDEKNELLVKNIEETISLLEENISFNNALMNENGFKKISKLLFKSDKKVDLVNSKIEEINKIYEEINNLI